MSDKFGTCDKLDSEHFKMDYRSPHFSHTCVNWKPVTAREDQPQRAALQARLGNRKAVIDPADIGSPMLNEEAPEDQPRPTRGLQPNQCLICKGAIYTEHPPERFCTRCVVNDYASYFLMGEKLATEAQGVALQQVQHYFCGLCGDTPEPCEHLKEVKNAGGKRGAPICKVCGEICCSAHRPKIEAGAQPPQDAHSEKAFTLHCRCGSDFKPECPDCHTLYQETYPATRSTPSPDPPQKCACSEKDAAVCESMPQHQPEYCRVKEAVAPVCKKCGQPKTEMRVITGKGKYAHIGSYKCWPCANEEAENEAAPDSPPQIVSAPVTDYEVGEFLAQNCNFPVPHWAEGFDEFKKLLTQLRVASSSNAALLDKIQKLRFKLYHYAPFDGKSHTTACSIWREDGQGHAEGFDGSMGPCNCGALINYWRERAEAAESKVKDAANEIHMLERAAESHKHTVSDLVTERDELREALRKYGNHRIVCTVHM